MGEFVQLSARPTMLVSSSVVSGTLSAVPDRTIRDRVFENILAAGNWRTGLLILKDIVMSSSRL